MTTKYEITRNGRTFLADSDLRLGIAEELHTAEYHTERMTKTSGYGEGLGLFTLWKITGEHREPIAFAYEGRKLRTYEYDDMHGNTE